MIRNRINKIVIISVLIISLLICNFSFVYAEDIVEDETIPTIYSDNKTIQQGSYFTSYIKAKDFKDIGSFELFIYYDTDILGLSSCNTSTLLSNEYVSINKDTPGEIKVYVASVNGINGSGNLLNLGFNVESNASVGISKVIIAVGDANLTDLSSVEIQTSSFNVDVTEKPVSKNTINFNANNVDSLTYNSSFNIKYYVSSFTYNFSSAEFLITYDANLLKYEEIKIGDSLNKLNGSLVSVNSGNKGIIKVTFAALEGVSNYLSSTNYLFDIKFTVINNVDDNAFVTITSTQMYDINLNQIYANSYTKNIKVDKKLSYIGFDDFNGYDKEFVLEMKASKGLNLAAGDFIINYSKYNLSCLSVEKTIDSSMIVYNIIKDSNGNETGKIKFSFLLSGGVVDNDIICKIHFKPKQSGSFNISLSGSGLKDGNYKDISLSYLDTEASINITHEYQKVEYLAPTCTTKGHEEHKKCINCNYSPDKVTINSLGGHLYVSHNAKAPTCTEIGWYAYKTCSRCDYSTYSERPKLGHNYNSVVTKPTCEDGGYTTHTCSRCSDSFTDEYVGSLGHNYDNVVYIWNSNFTSLVAKRVCLNDSSHIERETVAVTYKVVNNPTCLEDGLGTYVSNEFTNTSFVKQTYEVVLDRLGHSLTTRQAKEATCTEIGWNEYDTCSRCDYSTYQEIKAVGHDYKDIVTKPTCTDKGYTTHICSRCNGTYIDSYVGELKHNYGDYISNNNGTHYHICKNDNLHIETFDCNFTEWEVITEALEFSEGLEKRVCEECNYVETRIIPALHEHSYSNEFTIDKEPTCTKIGLKSKHCVINNCSSRIEETVIEAKGHSYDSVVVKPTCLDNGYTTHTCNVCHDTYNDNYIDAIGHNYGEVFYTWSEDHLSLKAKHICINDESHYEEETVRAEYKVVTNPTCEEDGLGTYVSNEFTYKSFVKQTYEVVLSKLGHNYNKCNSNNDSTHTYICSNDISHIEVKACKFGNWIVVNEPGTFTKGLEKRVCEECKYEEFREIPELHEHQYSNEFTIDKEPTCTEDGLKSKHCTIDNCSSSIEETTISKLNHNYSVVTYEWSTDYSKVTAFTKCINDESHILKETVDTVYSVIKTPTCKEEGIGIYSTKAFTNEIFSEQTYEVTISKVNHSLEKHNAKEATCIEIGWNEYVTCTNCDYTTYEEIAILEHMYEDVVVDPTCIEDGYTKHTCSRCNHEYTDSIINALGHKYNDTVVKPTCTDKGYTKHICSRCNDEYTDNYIEKINHTESDWIVDKEPTTESVGQKHTECVVCGETIKNDTIPTIEKSGCALFSVARMISLMNIFVVVYIIRKKIFR